MLRLAARRAAGPDDPRPVPAGRRARAGAVRRACSASATCCAPPSSSSRCRSRRVAVVVAHPLPAGLRRGSLDPPRVEAGHPSTVQLQLDNVSRLPSGVLLMEDALPYALGGRPRFVLDRVEPRGVREVTYPVRSDVARPLPRRAAVGAPDRPVRPVRAGPLVRQLRRAGRHAGAVPAAAPCGSAATGPAAATPRRARSPSAAATTPPPASTATATTCARSTGSPPPAIGELMVRREEQPFQSRATLLLDSRGRRPPRRRPRLVLRVRRSARSARIGVTLAARRLRPVDAARRRRGRRAARRPAHRGPAARRARRRAHLRAPHARRRRRGAAQRRARRRARRGRSARSTSTRPSAWRGCAPARRSASPSCSTPTAGRRCPRAPRAAAVAAHDDVCHLLAGAGWRVLPVAHGTSLASVWPLAGGSGRTGLGPRRRAHAVRSRAMTTRDRLTLAAALAVALATSALRPVYEDLGWLLPVLGAVVAVSGAAALARLGVAPRGLQPVRRRCSRLLAYTALTFAGSTLAYGLCRRSTRAASLASTFRDGHGARSRCSRRRCRRRPSWSCSPSSAPARSRSSSTRSPSSCARSPSSGLPLLVLFAVPVGRAARRHRRAWPFVARRRRLARPAAGRRQRPRRPLGHAAAQRPRVADRPEPRPGGPAHRRRGARRRASSSRCSCPGLDGRLLGGDGTGSGLGGSRTTTTYNPLTRLAGQLQQPTAQELLTYRTTEGADYLRLTTLDRFDPDSGWSSSELSADIDDDRGAGRRSPRRSGRSAADRARSRSRST